MRPGDRNGSRGCGACVAVDCNSLQNTKSDRSLTNPCRFSKTLPRLGFRMYGVRFSLVSSLDCPNRSRYSGFRSATCQVRALSIASKQAQTVTKRSSWVAPTAVAAQPHRLNTQCLISGGLPKPRTNSGRPVGLSRQRSRRRSPAPVAPTPKSQPVFGFLRRLDRVIPTTTNKPTESDGSPATRSWPLFAKLFGQTRLLLGGPSSSV